MECLNLILIKLTFVCRRLPHMYESYCRVFFSEDLRWWHFYLFYLAHICIRAVWIIQINVINERERYNLSVWKKIRVNYGNHGNGECYFDISAVTDDVNGILISVSNVIVRATRKEEIILQSVHGATQFPALIRRLSPPWAETRFRLQFATRDRHRSMMHFRFYVRLL